jgi:hypothetical protein
MLFFPKFAAFNLGWRDVPKRRIASFIPPRRGLLTKPGMPNHTGGHSADYAEFLRSLERGLD